MNTQAQPSTTDPEACAPGSAPEVMPIGQASVLAETFKALAHPIRLQLLGIIRQQGRSCVCDLQEAVDVGQPTVSYHLKTLTSVGLLDREQDGPWAYFSLTDRGLTMVRAWLDELDSVHDRAAIA